MDPAEGLTASGSQDEPERPVRVRIAPSPTGHMHVGTARTALFNWLFAHSRGGRFVIRIEDTDRTRLVEESLEDLLSGLAWLGLAPDEGPGVGGPYAPYQQSLRLDLYREHADRLLEQGDAYRCFCSPERLQQVREERAQQGLKMGYDRRCRELDPAEAARRAAEGEPHVLRLKMLLEGSVTLHDQIRGEVTFRASELEDVIIMKSDGYPTYHFAVVVDDHLMGITHVLRADEWIPSAPIQLRLYEALGWPQPVWVHLPLVLSPDGKGKLSKRKSGERAQVRWYRDNGYLPEAMVNFLALLGWTYGDEETFSLGEAVERFRLEDIRPAPARWDFDKLDAMNAAYIRALGVDELAARIMPFLRSAGLPAEVDDVKRMVPLVRERLTTLAEAADKLALFWLETVEPEPADMVPKKHDAAQALELFRAASASLEAVAADDWREEVLESRLRELAEQRGVNLGPLLQPVRVAVTGSRVTPPLFGTLELIGRDTTLARLADGAAALERYVAEAGGDKDGTA
ncbi:MAG: glutamate--tRNA ligase [Anaerolineae bacterium]